MKAAKKQAQTTSRVRGRFRTTALYKQIVAAFPKMCERKLGQGDEHVDELNVEHFAKLLGCSRYHVYRTLDEEEMSQDFAFKIAKASDGAIHIKDLKPYLPESAQALLQD